MKLNKKTLRKMILKEMLEMGMGLPIKVVSFLAADKYYLNDLSGQELFSTDDYDDLAEGYVSLKMQGYNYVIVSEDVKAYNRALRKANNAKTEAERVILDEFANEFLTPIGKMIQEADEYGEYVEHYFG